MHIPIITDRHPQLTAHNCVLTTQSRATPKRQATKCPRVVLVQSGPGPSPAWSPGCDKLMPHAQENTEVSN